MHCNTKRRECEDTPPWNVDENEEYGEEDSDEEELDEEQY